MQNIKGRRIDSFATKNRVRIGAWAIVVLSAAAFADTACADMFLKLSGIEGESTNAKHRGEVDVTGVELPILAPAPTAGGGSGKVSCPSVTVYKNLDKASPILMKYLASGKYIQQAVLTVQRSGEEQADYYVLTMQEVAVSEVTQTSTDPSHLSDKVVLKARQYNFEYRPQSDTGGSPGVIKFGWNCATTEIT